jgi:hypothetical protein
LKVFLYFICCESDGSKTLQTKAWLWIAGSFVLRMNPATNKVWASHDTEEKHIIHTPLPLPYVSLKANLGA